MMDSAANKSEIEKIIDELVVELMQLDIEDIEIFREEYMRQLKISGVSDGLIALCSGVINVVIEEKGKECVTP